uniref:Cytochrome b561 domain-containing protein n=1 Tax=Talaromyces marneffei PM1 TaxID=1077442 RepID=A0A093V8B5_TALMA
MTSPPQCSSLLCSPVLEIYSYIGIGTGTVMQGSLIFVMYSNATGDGITLSPRIATGNKEPVLVPSLDVEILPGSNTSDGLMTVNARCKNCYSWNGGALNLSDTAYPWNYALGPNTAQSVKLKSNSLSANLEMHVEYGLFTLDMTRATATGGVAALPTSFTNPIGSVATRPRVLTPNYRTILHAVLATIPLVFFLPTGVIFLRFFPGSVRWHWVSQTLSSVVSILGSAVGIFLSTLFNKASSFGSTHQILGYVIVAGVLVQWFLGYWHHRIYKKEQRTTNYAFVHRNLGLTWSQAGSPVIIGYSVAVGVVAIAHFSLVAWKRWEKQKVNASEPKPQQNSLDVDTI